MVDVGVQGKAMADENHIQSKQVDAGEGNDPGVENVEGNLERREALRKIIKSTTYAVPIAMTLLADSKPTQAGLPSFV